MDVGTWTDWGTWEVLNEIHLPKCIAPTSQAELDERPSSSAGASARTEAGGGTCRVELPGGRR